MTGALLTFALASSLLVVMPGPDSLLVLRSIVVGGRRAACSTAAGVLTGVGLWVAAAVLGLSALLRASQLGYTALRVVGAVYLVTLGVQALRSLPRPQDQTLGPTTGVATGPAGGAGRRPRSRRGWLGVGFRAGLVTNLLNPKVGVFFVTFLPGFVPAGAPVGETLLLFGAVFVAEGALYFAVLVLLAERVSSALRRTSIRRRIDRITGVALIAFGLRLAVES